MTVAVTSTEYQDLIANKIGFPSEYALINGIYSFRPGSAEKYLEDYLETLADSAINKDAVRKLYREIIDESFTARLPKHLHEKHTLKNPPIHLMIDPVQKNKDQNGKEKDKLEISMQDFDWNLLKTSMEQSGALIKVIPGSNPEGSARETWTRDRFFKVGDTIFLPDPEAYVHDTSHIYKDLDIEITQTKADVRTDHKQTKEWAEANGYKVKTIDGVYFEGGNVSVDSGRKAILFSYDAWFSGNGAIHKDHHTKKIEDTVNEVLRKEGKPPHTVVELPIYIQHDTFYHLDTFAVLLPKSPDGKHPSRLLYFNEPNYLIQKTAENIQKTYGKDVVGINLVEAQNLTSNLITVGETIFTPFISDGLRKKLEGDGFKIFAHPKFQYKDAGAHCWTSPNLNPKSVEEMYSSGGLQISDETAKSAVEAGRKALNPAISSPDSEINNQQNPSLGR